jgi:hypothetical protein
MNVKPCLVTEFYIKDANAFTTTQSGAGWYVNSQAMRGDWYQNTCIELLKSKCFIGWQYFRFQDDTDSNKGIVDGSGNEYTGMTTFMNELNEQVYHLCDFYDSKSRRPNLNTKTKVFTASADTYVIPGTTSTTNYGTATEMEIRNNARESNIREAFLKFDLTAVKDSLQYLKHAQLDVYCTASDATSRSVFVSGLTDSSWQELTLTGAVRNSNTNLTSVTNRLSSKKGTIATGNLSFDITTWVNDQVNNGVLSVKIHDLTLTSTSIKIASREYADQTKAPKLTLSFYDPKSTDFQSVNADANYQIYPNPATDLLTIQGSDIIETELLTLTGQSVKKSNLQQIELSALPAGIYLVKIKTTEGKLIVRKLIKN